MFRSGDKADFERMLGDLLSRARDGAADIVRQVEHEFAVHGISRSSGTPLEMGKRIAPVHERAVNDSMRLIAQFSERTGTPIEELCDTARPRLIAFTSTITDRTIQMAKQVNLTQQAVQARERLAQHVQNALRDIQVGFIDGKAVAMTQSSTNQSKAFHLLRAIYDKTRNRTDPVFIAEIDAGLSEKESQVAWRYLKDRGVIDTFNIAYTARINGSGIDAIESALAHPDQPTVNFPAVAYNIVNNTFQVGTMTNSGVQQGGVHSNLTQTVVYGAQEILDLQRLVSDLSLHLDELTLDAQERRRAEAQIATLQAQLSDEPDPVIVRQAGKTLRNITEGAIGSLLASAVQPMVWTWAKLMMDKMFI